MRARRVSTCVRVGVRLWARACACSFVALLIHHATRIRHIVCGLSASITFLTLSHKQHDFRKKEKSY
jgi:hypothetical protein